MHIASICGMKKETAERMISLKDRINPILDSAIENSARMFRCYADYFRRKKGSGDRSENADRASGLPDLQCLTEMEDIAAECGAVFYGRELIAQYEDAPEHTLLFVTHELTLTGAPVVLFHFAGLLRDQGWQLVILSAEDGPLGALFQKENIPVIVLPELFTSDYIQRVRKRFCAAVVNTVVSAPVICRLSGTDTPVLWWIHESAAVYGKLNAQLIPRSVEENIQIYCAGEYAQRMLTSRAPRLKTRLLIYAASDVKKELENAEKRERTALTKRMIYASVGVIEKRKGQDILLQAIELLPQEVRLGSCFVFVGRAKDEEIRDRIRQKCKEDLEGIVFYEGLEPRELYEIYNQIRYFVCSSRDDPMPVVVAEAMSVGKPCLCSCSAGSAGIIKEYGAGMVYEKNDPRRLAKRITESYFLEQEAYETMSAHARKAYEACFSRAVFERNAQAAMERLLNSCNPQRLS